LAHKLLLGEVCKVIHAHCVGLGWVGVVFVDLFEVPHKDHFAVDLFDL
jgi:hypothetical protein